tara:strand:+ start:276 stop:632 length:357 start_codon:yes stop_codon:yes gene_type:complete
MNTTDTEIHGYLIDPFAETVTQVAYEGDCTCIYKHIKASLFTWVYLEDSDEIYVDDEGLYKDDQRFFTFKGYHEPLAGRGLVLGANAEGDTTSPKITMEKLTELISFGDVWDLMKKAG